MPKRRPKPHNTPNLINDYRQLGGITGLPQNLLAFISQFQERLGNQTGNVGIQGGVNPVDNNLGFLDQINTGLADSGLGDIGELLQSILQPARRADTSGILTNSQGFLGTRKMGGYTNDEKQMKRKRKFKFRNGGKVDTTDNSPTSKLDRKKLKRFMKKQTQQISQAREDLVNDAFDKKLEDAKSIFNKQYSEPDKNPASLAPRSGIQLMKKGGKVRKKMYDFQLGGLPVVGGQALPQQTVQSPDAIGVNGGQGGFLMPNNPAAFSPLMPSASQTQDLMAQEQLQALLQQIGVNAPLAQLGGDVGAVSGEVPEGATEEPASLGGLPVRADGVLGSDGPVIVPSRELTFAPGGQQLNEVTIVAPIPGLDAVVETPIGEIVATRRDEETKSIPKKRKRRRINSAIGKKKAEPRTGPAKSFPRWIKDNSK